ncbi:MAG: phosphotransferase [Alphaproteobacteria bacterium]|jgi:aminoglycoside phosphotransferase (APT) family kinase protein
MSPADRTFSRTDQVVPVLEQHQFDTTLLVAWMDANIDGFAGPLEIAQFQGGMSNPTFLMTDASQRRYVLRKKPPGKLLPSAHAVDREHRITTALGPTSVPVVRTLALCEDISIVGTEFFLMDHANGRVFHDPSLPESTPEERGATYTSMIETLAALHQVDFDAVDLGDYGRVGGYMGRQVARWSKQYEASKTDDLPAMDKLMVWLPENMPDDSETTIVHGDFRLENLVVAHDSSDVIAVLDWELSTLGHPLSDLAYNCLPYHWPEESFGDMRGLDPTTPGIPSEEDYVAAYCRHAGRGEIENWNFYLVLSLFRLAAIIQGVYYRGLQGNASSPEALLRRDLTRQLSTRAWSLVQKG